jgi:acetyl-CoA C-acetyltransferase
MTTGIRDRVAIIGMGCTRFGERWDCNAEDLMQEAFAECLADAGVPASQIDAAWLSISTEELSLGKSGVTLSTTLKLNDIPVTRVENLCASGSEALRGAAYAVAAGACDIALALGVEKLKDTGYGGLPGRTQGTLRDLWHPVITAPGGFAMLANAYMARARISREELKRAMAHVSWKSHRNGARNPKAHLRKTVPFDTILEAPLIADPLGLYDCCGVSDGAACAIVTTPERARELGKQPFVSIKALQLAASNGYETSGDQWDGSYLRTTRIAAKRAYAEAGITDPRKQLDFMEVHDCFSITELVTMEDLGVSPEGQAMHDILNGIFDADGALPCQPDGGLKCFGHPIGASGLRMVYESYLQLIQRAGARQLHQPSLALTHNLGGPPHASIAAICIFGLGD